MYMNIFLSDTPARDMSRPCMTFSVDINGMWRNQSRGSNDGGLVVGAIIMPKLSLQPTHSARRRMTLSVNINDMWRIQSRGTNDGGLVVGTIIKPSSACRKFGSARRCIALIST